MATLSYFTIAGQTRCRTTAGGRFEEYLSDALGSTICVPSGPGIPARQSRYTPYGQEYFNNGVFTAPRLGWVGRLGYWATPLRRAESYMRARHYGQLDARWTTVDPLWPGESAYGYVRGWPTLQADPTGLTTLAPGSEGIVLSWGCQQPHDPLDDPFTKKMCRGLCDSINPPNESGRVGPIIQKKRQICYLACERIGAKGTKRLYCQGIESTIDHLLRHPSEAYKGINQKQLLENLLALWIELGCPGEAPDIG